MIAVEYRKWYPFEDERLWHIKWNEEYLYESDREWLDLVNNLLYLGYFVGIHQGKDGLITVMVDTTWFNRR